MKGREFKALKKIEERRAKVRQIRKPIESVVENLPPQIDTGKSRDKAAAKVGWSGKTGEQAEKVIDHIDHIKDTAPEETANFSTEWSPQFWGDLQGVLTFKMTKADFIFVCRLFILVV